MLACAQSLSRRWRVNFLTSRTLSRVASIEGIVILYWFVFWTSNGLDKFVHGTDLIVFHWYGRNRSEQFGGYFEKADLPEEFVSGVLYSAGVWELLAGLLFLAAGLYYIYGGGRGARQYHRNWNAILLGLFMSALTFVTFALFDVIVGDRAELLEHSIYFGLVLLSWIAIVYRRDRAIGDQGASG